MFKTIIITLSAIILLSSCSTVMKRKYTKGYYVCGPRKHATPKKEPVAKNTRHDATPALNNPAPIEPVYSSAETLPVQLKSAAPGEVMSNKTQEYLPNRQLTASASKYTFGKTFKKKSIDVKPLVIIKQKNKALNKSGSDAKLILMVILCFFIFINLIPVYIHDNNSITLNFWLTLLLDFTYIGGVIYSLLVVLGVVDLS